jgi:hypothetical protein
MKIPSSISPCVSHPVEMAVLMENQTLKGIKVITLYILLGKVRFNL